MDFVCWVGRVKSTIAPAILQQVFGEFGDVERIETGFAGFAFVEFRTGDAAEKAIKGLNNTSIDGVGTILVSGATSRGYEDACRKRGNYWRGRLAGAHGASSKRDRSQCRSRSLSSRTSPRGRKRRRRHVSRSRSGRSTSSAPTSRRSPSVSRQDKSLAMPPPRDEGGASAPALNSGSPPPTAPLTTAAVPLPRPRRISHIGGPSGVTWNGPESHDVFAGACKAKAQVLDQEEPPLELDRSDREEALSFFDGAGAYDLLLEAASVLRAALPDCLNGFPHAYAGLAMEDAGALLNAVAGFVTADGNSIDEAAHRGGSQERSLEVRQSIVLDARGGRLLRKVVVVDGATCFSEDLKL
eukprot:CAMPEP_0117549992 /NCGR_PEP_ID=MMETSP0784-20121206/48451_1 /TAXON_ID=39447 /ORGANISM="" /LENGTH=354 /DNA_ID=CAMNT_0005346997 /DNA_START=133 /DNA_END=1197 /DNA_ORIENTATION=+